MNSSFYNNNNTINRLNPINSDNFNSDKPNSERTTIIVTGASRGIGKAIAIALSSPSANIVISCSKSSDELKETYDSITARGALCTAYVGDMGSFSDVQEMFDLTLSLYGKTDVLINNAGIASIGLFQDTTPDMWNNIISVNLNSVYNCCHFAVNDMLRRHCGRIINISSVWGLYGASCEVAYSASKGAVNSFTKALAKELAPSHIQVNAIACGAIDTSMNGHLSKEELDELACEIPAGTLGKPEGVARLVKLMLESDDYLTGQVIQYDGGWIWDLTFMTEVCLMKLPEKKILRLNILKSTTRNQKKHIFPEESVHIPIL